MVRIVDEDRAKVPMLADFISAKDTDTDSGSTFASVGNLKTPSNVDSGGVLIRASPLDGTSKRVEPTLLRLR